MIFQLVIVCSIFNNKRKKLKTDHLFARSNYNPGLVKNTSRVKNPKN